MAKRIREIMNAELFSVGPDATADEALGSILALGITAIPVLDAERKPIGVVSMRDLVAEGRGETVGERMTRPVRSVSAEATIEQGARTLADGGVHRLVVLDAEGRGVGMVSAVDLLRGMLGLPARHPAAFPHLDPATGLSWTEDRPLELDHADAAPNGPGLLVLVHGGAGEEESAVWVESSPNVRTRVHELLSVPQDDPALGGLLERDRRHLRFRAAALGDEGRRQQVLERLRRVIGEHENFEGHPVP